MGRHQSGRVFALTGGIGSGKSTVARLFEKSGVPVVDADQLARLVVLPNTEGLREIEREFGKEVLRDDGTLNRQELGKKVFADPAARLRLNAIVHPRVQQAAHRAFQEAFDAGHRLVCYEIPLLFETAQEDRFRPVVLVTARPERQIARIMARDGLTDEEAKARLASQMPLQEKAARADFLIENDSDLEALEQVARDTLERVEQRTREV